MLKRLLRTSRLLSAGKSPGWEAYRSRRHEQTIPERLDTLRGLVGAAPGAAPAASAELAKLLFDCIGPVPATVQELRRLVDRLGSARDDDAERVRGHLASALFETSDAATAVDLAIGLVDRAGPLGYDHLSIAALEHLHLFGVETAKIGAECMALMREQSAHQAAFERELADATRSIAVVGNSPVGLGLGQGAEIDGHDVVIRFNNYSDDAIHAADYGRRTTVWARAATHTTVWHRPTASFDFVLFTGVDRRYHGPKFWDVLEAHRAGARPVFVPTRVYVDLVQRLGFPPSGGLQILHWLRSLRGPLVENGVRPYGFRMDDQEANRSSHYFKDLTSRQSYWHNWAAEGAFFRSAIMA